MPTVVRDAKRNLVGLCRSGIGATLVVAGGCAFTGSADGPAAVLGLSDSNLQPPASSSGAPATSDSTWAVRLCRPPKSLCGLTVRQLEQGAVLDFRADGAHPDSEPRLLSPFAVVHVEALDKSSCQGKLCAAHVALAGLQEELLKQGYHTQNVVGFTGGVIITLRSERIDRTLTVLKGSCRFNLDLACRDLDEWLQEDAKSGERCGFGQTRVFVASAAAPEFVASASFVPAHQVPLPPGGSEILKQTAFDVARTRIYELLYIHKICRSEMVLIRTGARSSPSPPA
jgi:hypothetical protein